MNQGMVEEGDRLEGGHGALVFVVDEGDKLLWMGFQGVVKSWLELLLVGDKVEVQYFCEEICVFK